ncbi:MAG: DUF4421 domain-containing protein [Muribaculaceae bacterium]|nr:DUF4421 domain-containing protein [Muribaculaceae bacterium]
MKMLLYKLLACAVVLTAFPSLSLAQDFLQDLDSLSHTNFRQDMIEESMIQEKQAMEAVNEIEHEGHKLLMEMEDHVDGIEAPMPPKDAQLRPLTYTRDQKWWWNLLKQGKLKMNDSTVVWPKFLKFCVDVYNWADHTFNSYDPQYVIGTGKRWKVRLVSDNWLDTYAMKLPQGVQANMSSDISANIGAYIQYMAVSIGSSYDIEKLFNHKEPMHKKYQFGFICALFNVEMYYLENRGGVNIRKFGNINDGKLIKEYFPGVSMYSYGLDAYYFFNNKKYSQGAAYNFAKYQLKSQGSFMAGISIANQKLSFDFSQLPESLKHELPDADISNYYFHYNSYAILAGYGYNWVIAPRLLFNATVMPSIGFSHYYEDSIEGDKYLLSLNIQGKLSLTYNLGNYFFGIFGNLNGHLYKQGRTSLFSSVENFSAYIGLRF